MTNESGSLANHDESESGLSDTPPGHRAGSPSLLTLMGPTPKSAAGFSKLSANQSVDSDGDKIADEEGYLRKD
jgi:hypothetical protein